MASRPGSTTETSPRPESTDTRTETPTNPDTGSDETAAGNPETEGLSQESAWNNDSTNEISDTDNPTTDSRETSTSETSEPSRDASTSPDYDSAWNDPQSNEITDADRNATGVDRTSTTPGTGREHDTDSASSDTPNHSTEHTDTDSSTPDTHHPGTDSPTGDQPDRPSRDADPRPTDTDHAGDTRTPSEVREPDRTDGPAETREEYDTKFEDFKGQTRNAIADVPGPDDGDSPVARADLPSEPEETGDEPATPDAAGAKREAAELKQRYAELEGKYDAVISENADLKQQLADSEQRTDSKVEAAKAEVTAEFDAKLAALSARVDSVDVERRDQSANNADSRVSDVKRGNLDQADDRVEASPSEGDAESSLANVDRRTRVEPDKDGALAGDKDRPKWRPTIRDAAIATASFAGTSLAVRYPELATILGTSAGGATVVVALLKVDKMLREKLNGDRGKD